MLTHDQLIAAGWEPEVIAGKWEFYNKRLTPALTLTYDPLDGVVFNARTQPYTILGKAASVAALKSYEEYRDG